MAERRYGGLSLDEIEAALPQTESIAGKLARAADADPELAMTMLLEDGSRLLRGICVKFLPALIARAREADGKEEGWCDIESAPESTDVLVYIPMAKRHPVRIGRYGLKGNGKRLWVYGGEFAFDVGVATLWRPIAAPPAKAHEAADDGEDRG